MPQLPESSPDRLGATWVDTVTIETLAEAPPGDNALAPPVSSVSKRITILQQVHCDTKNIVNILFPQPTVSPSYYPSYLPTKNPTGDTANTGPAGTDVSK